MPWDVSAVVLMTLPFQTTQSHHRILPPTLRPTLPLPTTPPLTPPLRTHLPLTQSIPAVGLTRSSSLPPTQSLSRKEMSATSRPTTETKGGGVLRHCSSTAQAQSCIMLMRFYIWFNTLFHVCVEQGDCSLEMRNTAVYVRGSWVRS